MLLEGAPGGRHLGGPETAIVWGKKMSNKEKRSPMSWFVGLPQIKWVSWQEWDHACRLSFVALAYSMLVNSATTSPNLSLSLAAFLERWGVCVCVWGAFWDFTFSTGRLLHPAGLAGSMAPFEEEPVSHDYAPGGVSIRGGLEWEIINIFNILFYFWLGI